MKEITFISKIWLIFKKSSIEKSYDEFRSKSYNCWINSLSIFGLTACVLNLILQAYLKSSNTNANQYPWPDVLYLSYAATAVNIILSFLILFLSNTKARKLLYYVQYLATGISLFFMNFSVAFSYVDTIHRYNIYGIEALIRIINIVGVLEFIDCFIVTIVNILVVIVLYLIFTQGQVNAFFCSYIFFTICFVIVSYFIAYLRKICFYYCEEYRIGKDRFRSIIQNVNSGYIHVKDHKICFINEIMKKMIAGTSKIMKKIKESHERTNNRMMNVDFILDDEFFEVGENSRIILNELLKDFQNNQSVYEERNILGTSHNVEVNLSANHANTIFNNNTISVMIPPDGLSEVSLFEALKKKRDEDEDKFKFIGIKTILTKNIYKEDILTLEVYCRYFFNQESKKDEFEIIFNNITKAKPLEDRKSEMKFKSLLLSKVAHEFKNPLICISELIIQLIENFRLIKQGENDLIMNCEDTLNQINSFSNYLMILIKDFDYCSQKDIQVKKVPLDIEECELRDTIKFCNDIALSLLKRNGKDKSIDFQIEKANDVPDIVITDEIRLKQVLINMISNSIKFTNQGNVTLKINREEEDLQFRVSDTGVGISTMKSSNNFSQSNSFAPSIEINPHGPGLGMSIIQNLTEALGKRVEIKSELNKGSELFFTIPIRNKIPKKFSSKSVLFEDLSRIENKEYPSYSPTCNNFEKDENNSSKDSSEKIIRGDPKKFKEKIKKLLREKKSTKSLFFRNTMPEIRVINQISIQNQCNNESINYIENVSIRESLDNISERNLSSKRAPKNRTIIFPNTKFMLHTLPAMQNSENNISMEYSRFSINSRNISDFCGVESNRNSIASAVIDISLEAKNILQHSKKCTDDSPKIISNKKQPQLPDYIDPFYEIINFNTEIGYFNILLVDDEKLTRSANRRLITVYAKNNNIKVNFIEAEDGFECLFILYVCNKKGVKISCVISDQTMNYLDGNTTATALKELAHNDALLKIPFYILTAYEDENVLNKLRQSPITNVFSKPMKKPFIEQIFLDLNKEQ